MAGQNIIRRRFRDFKGLNQAASDLDRDEMYAETADNIRQYRRGDVGKREGCVPQGHLTDGMGWGMHVADLNKSQQIVSTGYQEGASAGETARIGASSWASESNATTSNNSYATAASVPGSGGVTNWLWVDNFSLSVPSAAVITGIEIRVETSVAAGGTELGVYGGITTDGGTTILGEVGLFESTGESTGTVGTTDERFVLGSKLSKFDVNNLSPSIVNSSDFGAAFYLQALDPGTFDIRVDAITLQVFYTDQSTSEELLSIGNQLYRQREGSITITNNSGSSGTFGLVPTASGYQATLTEGGLPVAGWPKTYDTGTAFDSIGTLYTDLNAVTGWSMTATPIARVDGAVSSGTSITVDSSPQTFSDHSQVGFEDSDLGVTVWRHIHEITGTPSFELDLEASVADNQWLGLGREPISSIEVAPVETLLNGASRTLTVPYMEGVPNIATTEHINSEFPGGRDSGLVEEPFVDPSYTNEPKARNYSFTNLRSNAYFGMPFYKAKGMDLNANEKDTYNTGLWKYDGIQTHLAGLPPISDRATLTAGTSGGALTSSSTYRYRFQLSYTDANGNFVDGPLSKEYSVTLGGSDVAVTIALTTNLQQTLFPHRRAKVASTTSGTNTATVNAGHGLLTGMMVRLFDTAQNEFTTRQVTATTRTTVTLDGQPMDFVNSLADPKRYISQLKLLIWRTEADGTVFYLEEEVPTPTDEGVLEYVSGQADSNLGAQLIPPDRVPDLFPKLSYLASHQGLIVGSGNPDSPETVYFADALNTESSPSSTSNFRVSGGDTAEVTALASDNDDMLAVFKRNAYFNVVGDLDSLSFQVLTVSESDYGCPAHHGIQKVNDTLIFPSETGFKAIAGGRLVSNFDDRLLLDFSNSFYQQVTGEAIDSDGEAKLVVRRAVSAYDPDTKQYVCYVPKETGTPGSGGSLEPTVSSVIYVYNFVKDAWYTWSLPQQNNMAGGVVVFKDNFWWQARTYNSGLFGQVHKRRDFGTGLDFYDDITAVSMTLRMSWDDLDFPASWFRPLFLKVYRFEPDGLSKLSSSLSFELQMREYRNYDESVQYTQASRTFEANHKQRRFKFKSGRASAISLEFLQPNAEESGAISGYEYQVAAPYDQQRLKTRGESNS